MPPSVFPAPPPPSASRDLARLHAPAGRGVYASDGENFRDAVFGRDSIEVAEDLLRDRPDIAREVILALARLQGTRLVAKGRRCNEEQPGRIHHESRERVVGGHLVSLEAQRILDDLAAKWGGDQVRMTYYGSIDATPLYVRLVARYCERIGSDAILTETVDNKDGDLILIGTSVRLATRWVARNIEASEIGLFEYQRRNPRGIEYQGWRDGKLSLLHPPTRQRPATAALPGERPLDECGALVFPDQPIATIETQGLAYDALVLGSAFFTNRAERARLESLATGLRERALQAFWMPSQLYFASAIDRDPEGRPRQVAAITASPAELLDTGFFDGLDANSYRRYTSAIVRRITSAEFLTPAGVRCVSLRHFGILDHVAYQGSFTVWHKQNYDIAKGLRRHGFPRLATQITNRMLNTCNAAGDNSEYVYVDALNRVCLDPRNRRGSATPDVIAATNVADMRQAWTVSAAYAVKRQIGRREVDVASADLAARRLEVDLLGKIPNIGVESSRTALAQCFQRSHDFVVDQQLGEARQTRFVGYWEGRWRQGPADRAVGVSA